MKVFWSIYYMFVIPISKSGIAIRWARMNGVKVVKLETTPLNPKDMLGLPEVKDE